MSRDRVAGKVHHRGERQRPFQSLPGRLLEEWIVGFQCLEQDFLRGRVGQAAQGIGSSQGRDIGPGGRFVRDRR